MGAADLAGARDSAAAVAALLRPRQRLRRRRWRRRFPAATADPAGPAGTGRVHDSDTVWIPAAWLTTTRALRPLARHRSYSAVKSVAETAGCCRGRDFITAQAPSPLATSAHVGAAGEL